MQKMANRRENVKLVLNPLGIGLSISIKILKQQAF